MQKKRILKEAQAGRSFSLLRSENFLAVILQFFLPRDCPALIFHRLRDMTGTKRILWCSTVLNHVLCPGARVGVARQLKYAKESSKANWGPVVLLEQPAAFAVPAHGILDGHFSPEMASAMF